MGGFLIYVQTSTIGRQFIIETFQRLLYSLRSLVEVAPLKGTSGSYTVAVVTMCGLGLDLETFNIHRRMGQAVLYFFLRTPMPT